jgi:hypothetical protein
MTQTRVPTQTDRPQPTSGRDHRILSALLGVVAVLVLLQGLWAGLFLGTGGDGATANAWMEIHARGADLTILLALVTTGWAFRRLRPNRELWLGSAALTVLLVLEAYLGGRIRDNGQDSLTAIHVPLAMAMMALVVWLPLRARALKDQYQY